MDARKQGRRKQLGVFLLAAVSLAGVGSTSPARQFLSSANHFVCYYRALGNAGVQAGFWERIALSFVLASSDSAEKCSQTSRS